MSVVLSPTVCRLVDLPSTLLRLIVLFVPQHEWHTMEFSCKGLLQLFQPGLGSLQAQLPTSRKLMQYLRLQNPHLQVSSQTTKAEDSSTKVLFLQACFLLLVFVAVHTVQSEHFPPQCAIYLWTVVRCAHCTRASTQKWSCARCLMCCDGAQSRVLDPLRRGELSQLVITLVKDRRRRNENENTH